MTWFTGLDLLDGTGVRRNMALRIAGQHLAEVTGFTGQQGIDLAGAGARALVSPGLVDCQVNGGAGQMIGPDITGPKLCDIADAHWATGTRAIVPTLISDTAEVARHVMQQASFAQDYDASQIIGLHFEGPHIAVAGAHDPDMLRPMTDDDIALYKDARHSLGTVIVTVAPEIVTPDQIKTLVADGITVALGHTACDYDTARAAFDAGAVMATHLFNAMSGLHHRAPGLVGAALDQGAAYGLIADGHHVHPAAIRTALKANPKPVLVSDAMALTGSTKQSFVLNTRVVHRRDGRLTLEDGTLAGADLSLVQAVENLARWTDTSLETLIPLAFNTAWQVLHGTDLHLQKGARARLLIWRDQKATDRIDGTQILPLKA